MGTIQTGRQGYAGFALQTDFATPNTTPEAYLPFNELSLEGKHEPIPVQSSRANRAVDVSSVEGKKSSDGDIQIDLSIIHSGYLWKLHLGNEILTTGTPNVHNFYATYSGNTPKFATLIRNYGDTKVEQYTVASNTIAMAVTDGLMTLTTNLMGKLPTDGATQVPATTSGTVMTFSRYSVHLGATLAAADVATPIPVEEFNLESTNNLIVVHSSRTTAGSNSNDVRTIRLGDLAITGSYKIFFDSADDRNNYYNLIKKSMIVKVSEGALEECKIRVSKISCREEPIETGLSDLFALQVNWTGELDATQEVPLFDVLLSNSKSTVY